MSEPFLLIGLQLSIVFVLGFVLVSYVVLALCSLLWAGAEFVALHMRHLVRLAEEKPLATPVVPMTGATPLPAIRRRIAYK